MRAFIPVLVVAAASWAVPEGIPIQYMDSHHRMPTPASQSPAFAAGGAGCSIEFSTPSTRGMAGRVIVIVEDGLDEEIEPSLTTFFSDLSADGFSPELWILTGGSPAGMRSYLQAEYAEGGLSGAVLVGNVPTGWMETSEGEYPVDLYLMDMNGTWTDADGNGLFEYATSWAPEIFVGRLTPTWLSTGTSAELLSGYFARNHAYRTGYLTLPDRALAYEEAFTGLTGYLGLVYSDVTTKNDPAGTTADDYRAELLNGYEWVHLIAHSSPWGSSFHEGAPPGGAGTFNNYEVVPLDPHAFFYVLNCCTNGRWTEIDNLANMYIWADTYGLAAIAQAKTDYTNDFQELYTTLAAGGCVGEAFRVWLGANLSYEHAAVLLGDPTLRPHGNGRAASVPGRSPGGVLRNYWTASQLTGGIHSEGDTDAVFDPVTGEVFAVFGTSSTVRANILGTVSTGDTWITPMQICEHEYWDWHPAVGTNGQGTVWAAWHSMYDDIGGYDIFVSSWTGSSWGSAVRLTQTPAFEVEPSVAGGSGRGWVVWQQWTGGQSDIAGRMWTGGAWTTTGVLSGQAGDERLPDIAFSGGSYGLVYQAEREGDLVIAFRDAPDSGPFGPEVVISSPGGACREPVIAGDGTGGFWVAWEQEGGIRVRRRETGAWQPEVTVCAAGTASKPTLACLSGETLAAGWIEDGSSIRYKLHTPGGWGPAITGADCPAVESAVLAYRNAASLVALFGARDEDLHWDVWAASTDPSGLEEGGAPGAAFSIRPSFNPAHGACAFTVAAPGPVLIDIFDLCGRLVRRLEADPGPVEWNGRSGSGTAVPSGTYLVRASCGLASASCRLTVLE
ncbi:hypothetical protein GX411_06710 [Candidatus Fermentibacteria bacterium]|nr:hypothetical protein [Candidatus Fermentibacteria bacterium]